MFIEIIRCIMTLIITIVILFISVKREEELKYSKYEADNKWYIVAISILMMIFLVGNLLLPTINSLVEKNSKRSYNSRYNSVYEGLLDTDKDVYTLIDTETKEEYLVISNDTGTSIIKK